MADVYVNALTQISTEPDSTDSLVAVNRNTNEGKIIDYNLLADVILDKIASKQFSSLDTTSKLLVGAINELDSDIASQAAEISSLNSSLTALESRAGYRYRDTSDRTEYTFSTISGYGLLLLITQYDLWAVHYDGNGATIDKITNRTPAHALTASYNSNTRIITITDTSTLWGGITVYQ